MINIEHTHVASTKSGWISWQTLFCCIYSKGQNCAELINFPTLGRWVFVVDVTRGEGGGERGMLLGGYSHKTLPASPISPKNVSPFHKLDTSLFFRLSINVLPKIKFRSLT